MKPYNMTVEDLEEGDVLTHVGGETPFRFEVDLIDLDGEVVFGNGGGVEWASGWVDKCLSDGSMMVHSKGDQVWPMLGA